MNASLTPQLEKMIHRKIKTGRYRSASEVVREALRKLDESERDRSLHLAELKREVAFGIRQADRGLLVPFDEALAADIKRRGRKRLARSRNSHK